jgi:hypothetical protein
MPIPVNPQQFQNQQQQPPSSPNQTVEKAVASLILALLKNKIPKSIQNVIGFHLVEYDEDVNEGSGFAVMKLGKLTGYVPVIFDKGDVRGLDVLFIKELLLFVPNDDEWIEFLANQQLEYPGGKPADKQDVQRYAVPDLTRALTSPVKQASYKQAEIYKDFYKNIKFGERVFYAIQKHFLTKKAHVKVIFEKLATVLPSGLPRPWNLNGSNDFFAKLWKLSPDAAVQVMLYYKRYPLLEKYADIFYGNDKIYNLLKKAVKPTAPGTGYALQALSAGGAGGIPPAEEEESPPPRRRGRRKKLTPKKEEED